MSVNRFIPLAKYSSLRQVVESCRRFYSQSVSRLHSASIHKHRLHLAAFIEKFHTEAGTITPAVERKIDILRKGSSVLLMTAHQPNLFPYSGVMRKATLNHVLAGELKKRLGIDVVSFFGIADQDFSDDRWVKSTLLPAVFRKDGVFPLSAILPEGKVLSAIKKPSPETVGAWKKDVDGWVHSASLSIKSYCQANGLRLPSDRNRRLRQNLSDLWDIVEQARAQSQNYADFNAFFLSKVVNNAWKYDTLFARFSECQSDFVPEFNHLVSHFDLYSQALKKGLAGIDPQEHGGVSDCEPDCLPFWYHCDCGGKVRLFPVRGQNGLTAAGPCLSCRFAHRLGLGPPGRPDVSSISPYLSARAIPMILVFSQGLGLSCYTGGVDGLAYLEQARYAADALDILLPPIVVWRPHDVYMGIAQLEAWLEFKRITGHFDVNLLDVEVDRLKDKMRKVYGRIDKCREQISHLDEARRKGEIDRGTFENRLKQKLDWMDRVKRETSILSLAHDLIILENLPRTLHLIPGIIDYALNIGLESTSRQWVNFLVKNGSLAEDITMKSILDGVITLGNSCVQGAESRP